MKNRNINVIGRVSRKQVANVYRERTTLEIYLFGEKPGKTLVTFPCTYCGKECSPSEAYVKPGLAKLPDTELSYEDVRKIHTSCYNLREKSYKETAKYKKEEYIENFYA